MSQSQSDGGVGLPEVIPLSNTGSVADSAPTTDKSADGRAEHVETQQGPPSHLLYAVDSVPSWQMTLLFGVQQATVFTSRLVVGPLIVATLICGEHLPLAKVYLMSTTLLVCGISSFIQTTFGIRLPIIQGPSAAFLVPVVALMQIEAWQCPAGPALTNATLTGGNLTAAAAPGEEAFRERLLVIQGGQTMAALFQIMLGCTGVMGYLMRYVGPLTVTPTVSLIGISLFDIISRYASKQWGITFLTVAVFLLLSMYLGHLQVPCVGITCRRDTPPAATSKWRRIFPIYRVPIFSLFPYILSIGIVWVVCAILTLTDAIPPDPASPGYHARVDGGNRLAVLQDAPWVRVPYPGQWGGAPTLNLAIILGCFCAALVSIIESVGDYCVVASTCEVQVPPAHAINRGIAVEGLGCLLSGLLGAGLNVTSYSDEVGLIGITRVASRRATQAVSVIFCIIGLMPKFSALFAALPDPIIGGIMTIGLGMVASVGLSNLQHVNLKSSRNLVILGLSLLVGLMFPKWLAHNSSAINTGSEVLDQALAVLLGTPMFIGGSIGFVLDNTVPVADPRDRGLFHHQQPAAAEYPPTRDTSHVYDLPWVCSKDRRSVHCHTTWLRYLPILPK